MVKSKWTTSEHTTKFNKLLKNGMDSGGLSRVDVVEALTLLVKECDTYSVVEDAYWVMKDGIKEVMMAVMPMDESAKEPIKPQEAAQKAIEQVKEDKANGKTYPANQGAKKSYQKAAKQPDFGWGKDNAGNWAVFIPQAINAEDYANSFVWVVNKSGKKSKVFMTTLDHEVEGGYIFSIDQEKTQAEKEKYFNGRQ